MVAEPTVIKKFESIYAKSIRKTTGKTRWSETVYFTPMQRCTCKLDLNGKPKIGGYVGCVIHSPH